MTRAKRKPSARTAADAPRPACRNAAVARCCDAWERVFQSKLAQGEEDYYARRDAHEAYRGAMPPLSGYKGICDFISCVTHGILIDAIEETRGSKLLYAAQVALSSLRNQPKLKQPRSA